MLEQFLKDLGVKDPYPDGRRHNPEFDRYASNIKIYAACPDAGTVAKRFGYSRDEVLSYRIPLFSAMLDNVLEHKDELTRPLKDEVVAIVHPAYEFLANPKMISNGHNAQAQEYLSRLQALIKHRKSDKSIVFFDTIHQYAAFSSILLEQGLIDDVLITNYNAGFVHGFDNVDSLKGRKKYMAGGNNGDCLTDVCRQLAVRHGEELYVVPEIVVQSPEDGRFLEPDRIYADDGVEFPAERRVKMAELIM